MRRGRAAGGRCEEGQVRIIHIVGKRNHGKTTLVEALVSTLTERGVRVGTIKHCGHPHDLDIPGKDSYRHQAAGASATVVLTPERMALHRPRPDDRAVHQALAQHFADCDVVLCEGWLDAEGVKVEVWREEAGGTPLAEFHEDVVAIISDDTPPVVRAVWPRSDVDFIADRMLELSRNDPRGGREDKEEARMSEAVSPHDPMMLFVQGHDGVSEWLHNLEATVSIRQDSDSEVTFDEIRDYFHKNVREHFAFEEEVVFPALLTLEPSDELRDLIRELRMQHITLVNDASHMFQELALLAAQGYGRKIPEAKRLVQPIVERILAHAALEDHHIFPLLKTRREAVRAMLASNAIPDLER